MEANTSDIIITNLPLFTCHFVELPDNQTDCSVSDPRNCVRCIFEGKFLFGGGLNEFDSTGHIVSIILWCLNTLIGIFGTLTSLLIITIMKRQNSKRSFDLLLIALAYFDLLGSFSSVVASTSTLAIFGIF